MSQKIKLADNASSSYQRTNEQVRHITLIVALPITFYTRKVGIAAVGKKVVHVARKGVSGICRNVNGIFYFLNLIYRCG
jgi:hypothetical protein